MRSVLILGSGRSGTSMLAGSLAKVGYYMGASLLPPNESNPRGFFEDAEINSINEWLLAQVTPARPPSAAPANDEETTLYDWRWLAEVQLGTSFECPDYIAARIEAQAARRPFCFKDPRFCYTLPVWLPFVGDAACVCVFREPATTARSIALEVSTGDYLHGLSMTEDDAVRVWTLMYRHVLELHRHSGDWLFLHYGQILDGSFAPRLVSLLGVQPDVSFADPKLQRTKATGPATPEAERVYEELCELASLTA